MREKLVLGFVLAVALLGTTAAYIGSAGPITPIEHSFTISVAGASVQWLPASNTRRGCKFQNQSFADIRVSAVGNATLDFHSEWVPPGSYYYCKPETVATALNVTSPASGVSAHGESW